MAAFDGLGGEPVGIEAQRIRPDLLSETRQMFRADTNR
jgi:hypothetical protein